MGIFYTILDTIFPVYCLSCGARGSDLCFKCLSACPIAERESANWIFPIYDYRYPIIKKSIWLLKYKNKKQLAKVFAMTLHEKILETAEELRLLQNFENPIFIPIPLSKSRLRERKYNQTKLLCQHLRRLDPNRKVLYNTLYKTKNIEHQARITDKQSRLKNILDSFGVRNEKNIQGKNIILIDDVTTTGATLSEASKILKKSGAKKILAFTIAH